MTGLMMSLLLAAPGPRQDGARLLNELKRVSVLGTALYVAAHPDDENTRLLASLANEARFRAAYLSFTRGEGGQNLIGNELGPLLGVIRTQELLAARRLDGAEQYFTRARDFGFSKSVDETLATWDHERVLADAVFLIRALRPDLIITRFPLEAGGTHGHHTASARLAVEAFHAAADAKYHPEWPAWRAKRVVWNTWQGERMKQLPEGSVTWDTSQYSPLLGLSYGELAAESRSMHKSQGFGAAPVHEGSVEYFAPLAGDAAKSSLFDGVDTTWRRVPGAEKVSAQLAKATAEFQVDAPWRSVPALTEALELVRALPDNPWKAQKAHALAELIVGCAGLFVEASAAHWRSTPGEKVTLQLTALNRTPAALRLESVSVRGVRRAGGALERGAPLRLELEVETPADAWSTPYWLANPPEKGAWTPAATAPVGVPELPSPFMVEYQLAVGATRFSIQRAAYFKWVDPTAGERYRPIEVLPPVVVKPDAELLLFTDAQWKTVTVTVTANAEGQRGEVRLRLPEGYAAQPEALHYELQKDASRQLTFKVRPSGRDAGSGLIAIEANGPGVKLARVDYPHLPIQTVLTPAQVRVERLSLKRGRTKRVGYVAGAGDDVPTALAQAGYEVVPLGEEALRGEPLGRYDAIVLGVRAWNVHAWLPSVHERLMRYVEGGGTVVAQYNTRNWLSSVPAAMGPFPFEISQDRVTVESAPVTRAKHAIFTSPNVISEADFDGWVQERGLYFATRWDSRYETPLTMNDPGEAPSQGSLLIARHGKGRFVYTGLAFFRQLPAGVPGAWRLFANLIDRGN